MPPRSRAGKGSPAAERGGKATRRSPDGRQRTRSASPAKPAKPAHAHGRAKQSPAEKKEEYVDSEEEDTDEVSRGSPWRAGCAPHLATHLCVLWNPQLEQAAAVPLPEPALQHRLANKQRRRCTCSTVWVTLALALLCGALLLLFGGLDVQTSPAARPVRQFQRCTARNASSDLLASVLAPGFEEWAVSLVETLTEPDAAGAMTQEKAHVGALPPTRCLLCSLVSESHAAVLMASPPDVRTPSTATLDAALRAAFPGCSAPLAPRCMISRDEAADTPHDTTQRRGELQAWVVDALRQCPHGGLIVIHNIHSMPAAALPALLPLLSEAGQYTSQGEAVPAWPATVALTAQLRGLDACGSVAACQKRAKASLQEQILGGAGDEARVNLAGAFRRRIDDVALLRVATS